MKTAGLSVSALSSALTPYERRLRLLRRRRGGTTKCEPGLRFRLLAATAWRDNEDGWLERGGLNANNKLA